MSDHPDLSHWPDVNAGERPWPPLSDEAREALANVDFLRDGFPLHEHVVHDRAADGSVTLSVPWSDFRYTAPAAATEADAKRDFNRAYLDHVAASQAEQQALRAAAIAAGHVPLSERLGKQQQGEG
jgi:hypothetical protein